MSTHAPLSRALRLRVAALALLLVHAACNDAVSPTDGPAALDGGAPDLDCRGPLRPTARDAHSLVAISPTAALLFGGDSAPFDPSGQQKSIYSDDLWRWDLDCGAWSLLRPAPGAPAPSARGNHAAVFDGKRNRMLLLFGRIVTGAGAYLLEGDVWAFGVADGAWTELSPSGMGPSARQGHRAVYDAAGDRVILFGGNAGTSFGDAPQGDTWVLDFSASSDGAWSQVATSGGPSARQDVSLALDGKRGAVVLFGGAKSFISYTQDVWSLSLSALAWTQLTTSGTRPSRRFRAELAYDGARDRFVLFGGHDDGQQGLRNDLWAILPSSDGASATFSALSPGDQLLDVGGADLTSPERRDKTGLVLDGQERAWLFGGISDCGPLDDGWRLDLAAARWSTVWSAEVGETCYRRASGAMQCADECAAPM